jgi:HSP20 family protein
MTSYLTQSKEYQIYPGEYIPMPEIESLLEELKISRSDVTKPLLNMEEFRDCFKIEMAIPGFKREDIMIRVKDNVLTVMVMHSISKKSGQHLGIHEFEHEYLERQITLPRNADPEFASAEYSQGILSLQLPKTLEPSKSNANRIVVY